MTVNDKSVWDWVVPSNHNVEASIYSELESARLFAGLSIEQFETLMGVNEFATPETAIGSFESKADVLAYYRSEKKKESVLNYLTYNKGG